LSTISNTYFSAIAKQTSLPPIDDAALKIPLSVIANRSLGVQQALVRYLHDKHTLSWKTIATLLARDPRTIWTAYHAKRGGAS